MSLLLSTIFRFILAFVMENFEASNASSNTDLLMERTTTTPEVDAGLGISSTSPCMENGQAQHNMSETASDCGDSRESNAIVSEELEGSSEMKLVNCEKHHNS